MPVAIVSHLRGSDLLIVSAPGLRRRCDCRPDSVALVLQERYRAVLHPRFERSAFRSASILRVGGSDS